MEHEIRYLCICAFMLLLQAIAVAMSNHQAVGQYNSIQSLAEATRMNRWDVFGALCAITLWVMLSIAILNGSLPTAILSAIVLVTSLIMGYKYKFTVND